MFVCVWSSAAASESKIWFSPLSSSLYSIRHADSILLSVLVVPLAVKTDKRKAQDKVIQAMHWNPFIFYKPHTTNITTTSSGSISKITSWMYKMNFFLIRIYYFFASLFSKYILLIQHCIEFTFTHNRDWEKKEALFNLFLFRIWRRGCG